MQCLSTGIALAMDGSLEDKQLHNDIALQEYEGAGDPSWV